MRAVITVTVALLVAPVENQRAVFRSAAEEVRVDVLVSDGHHPIAGLTASDFELRDSGVVQTIENVEISEQPFSILLALDTSSSMEGASLRATQPADRVHRRRRHLQLAA